MKKTIAILCLLSLAIGLCACGEAAPSETQAVVPTTAAAPTETTSPYPTPDKVIALTFDDGPNVHMDTMLDIFAEYDGKATFFVIGNKVKDDGAAFVKRAVEEGHEIGNHSYSHEDMTVKTDAEILNEISLTQAAVKEASGTEPVWYRPPFLRANDLTYSLIKMPNAGCGVSVGDGSNDNLAEDRHYRLISGAYDGCIVLLHCNNITAEILPTMLHDLKMMGYEFVTISELFARVNATPDPNRTELYKDTK